MPVIARFYGIIIRMYFQQAEHNPPHIHALFGEDMAAIDIKSGKIIEGQLPAKTLSLVQKWILLNRSELLNMWDTQEFHPLPPLQ